MLPRGTCATQATLPDCQAMRTEDFWQLIDEARAGGGGDPGAVAARAVALLAERDPEDIIG